MLAARGVVGLALLALWLYCIIDVITTDESTVRHLPKTLWLLIVFFLPDVGSIVWLVAGRPEKASFRIGDAGYRPPKRPLSPEDRADFGVDLDGLSSVVRDREERAQLHLREEQLRRREEELTRKVQEAETKQREDDLQRWEKEMGGRASGPEGGPPVTGADLPPDPAGESKLEG